ncbi:HD domain-containing protein [Corynebacterium felinum]|uniref:(P)ppGpp synthase/HD superfamily hydrolase n=1 Tax=Corynebacterium felinum TaxID=131318 RepID=A0ABU2BA00_9CORY|nr:HD domain-containing protein [Corynebacterium felinum]MDF5820415.1 HD domain-containing protein [Corynebacterium felinum]MDR7355452.1 (p)ppGpp synthase/HD superfamily hydrolase [Corynebacterium felinum]WJY94803.1 Bifunctional (p)ppGpp synthase/hydrolase SpoT [Corynebacterium felinum]
MSVLSPRLMRAINVASVGHDGHYRKATKIPYISHLFAVMHILAQFDVHEDLLIAALLHDVIEDRPGTVDVEAEFGPNVARIVLEVTKDSSLDTWQKRADDYLARLEQASDEAVLLALADKYHNLQSILADFDEHGDKLWERFNAGKQAQQWWYTKMGELVARKMPAHPLVAEFAGLVKQVVVL